MNIGFFYGESICVTNRPDSRCESPGQLSQRRRDDNCKDELGVLEGGGGGAGHCGEEVKMPKSALSSWAIRW